MEPTQEQIVYKFITIVIQKEQVDGYWWFAVAELYDRFGCPEEPPFALNDLVEITIRKAKPNALPLPTP